MSAGLAVKIISGYGYYALFPAAILEGPIITVIAGALIANNLLNFWLAYAVIIAGDTAGDILYYLIGRWGRESFLLRWGKFIGIQEEHAVRLESHFANHGIKTMLLGKASHGIGAVFLVAAGLARMPFIKFLISALSATLPKSLLLLTIGYFFGSAISKIDNALQWISMGFLAAGITVVLYFYLHKKSAENE